MVTEHFIFLQINPSFFFLHIISLVFKHFFFPNNSLVHVSTIFFIRIFMSVFFEIAKEHFFTLKRKKHRDDSQSGVSYSCPRETGLSLVGGGAKRSLRALSSLRGLRGAPAVPPLCRETQSLGQQMLNATVGINGLNKT